MKQKRYSKNSLNNPQQVSPTRLTFLFQYNFIHLPETKYYECQYFFKTVQSHQRVYQR